MCRLRCIINILFNDVVHVYVGISKIRQSNPNLGKKVRKYVIYTMGNVSIGTPQSSHLMPSWLERIWLSYFQLPNNDPFCMLCQQSWCPHSNKCKVQHFELKGNHQSNSNQLLYRLLLFMDCCTALLFDQHNLKLMLYYV